jgi:hypothetical protein
MSLPVAHFGHVLVDLPIFLGPVLALGAWIWIETRRIRREDGDGSRRGSQA